MTDRNKGKPPAPQVQVIRRPPAGAAPAPGGVVPRPVAPTAAPRPVPAPRPQLTPIAPAAPADGATATAPAPRPSQPRPVPSTSSVSASPTTPSTSPVGAAPVPAGPRPSGPRGRGGPPRAGGFRGPPRGPPRPPPTPQQIADLARKERVPTRIAKGDLEGKMKCRIWKKLHAEEARRFDAAWVLVEANPGLDLADAFGVVQSGLSVQDFLARRARMRRKEEVKQARSAVEPAVIDAFIDALVKDRVELSFVLGERSFIDVITGVQPVAFDLEKEGPTAKLNVVLVARRTTWERLLPATEREPRLAQKPAVVSRQPSKRPVNDPRPFVPHVGQAVKLVLRNGITLTQPLIAVGPYDVLIGTPGEELFVPLHAMVSWSAESAAPA